MTSTSSDPRDASLRVVGALALAAALAIAILAVAHNAWPIVRSDGYGYQAYLPATLIDHDVSMARLPTHCPAAAALLESGLRPVADGGYVDKYPIGVAAMMSPFFWLADAFARIVGARRDGYSLPYQVAAAAAGWAYGFAGLLVVRRTLLRWFSPSTTTATLLALCLGTNLFHYLSYDVVFSHAYSFFLLALLLELFASTSAPASTEQRRSVAFGAKIGLVFGLIVLVRNTNAIAIALVALWGIGATRDARARAVAPQSRVPSIVVGAVVTALVVSPQLAYWHARTGHWVSYSYVGESFDGLHPKLAQVLLSSKKGLFVWSPVVAIMLLGLRDLRDEARAVRVPIAVALGALLVLVAGWHSWWLGGGFGHRAFTEWLAWLAIPLAAWIDRRRAAPAFASLVFCTSFTSTLMLFYWLDRVPFEGFARGWLLR